MEAELNLLLPRSRKRKKATSLKVHSSLFQLSIYVCRSFALWKVENTHAQLPYGWLFSPSTSGFCVRWSWTPVRSCVSWSHCTRADWIYRSAFSANGPAHVDACLLSLAVSSLMWIISALVHRGECARLAFLSPTSDSEFGPWSFCGLVR